MFSAVHEQLSDLALGSATRPQLEALLTALHRVETHAAERRLAVVRAIDALDDGGLPAAAVARSTIHCSSRKAERDAATASALAALPEAGDALASGASPSNTPNGSRR